MQKGSFEELPDSQYDHQYHVFSVLKIFAHFKEKSTLHNHNCTINRSTSKLFFI